MKKALPIIIVALIFLVGVGILSYPLVSSVINNISTRNHAQEELKAIKEKEPEEITRLFAEAERYNKSLLNTIILTDPFDKSAYDAIGENYRNSFNVNDEGLIGYVDIPKINVYLPIYHGTSAEVLERGAGHLDNTAFPIGGESTHSVISAHTAFPTKTFFDYLTDMQLGDEFYIHVLNRTLKYEVDQIKVVEPSVTEDLFTIKGEDHVTLLTCTPYSVNTHRLLVRGNRVEYKESDEAEEGDEVVVGRAFATDADYIYILGYKVSYTTVVVGIIAFVLIVTGTAVFIVMRRRRKSSGRRGGDGNA